MSLDKININSNRNKKNEYFIPERENTRKNSRNNNNNSKSILNLENFEYLNSRENEIDETYRNLQKTPNLLDYDDNHENIPIKSVDKIEKDKIKDNIDRFINHQNKDSFSPFNDDFLKNLELKKFISIKDKKKENINFRKSMDFVINQENKDKLKVILEESNDNSNSIINKYFKKFEDKNKTCKSIIDPQKRLLMKEEADQIRIKKSLKEKEEKLDNLFNKQLNYSKIVKENINFIKNKFLQPKIDFKNQNNKVTNISELGHTLRSGLLRENEIGKLKGISKIENCHDDNLINYKLKSNYYKSAENYYNPGDPNNTNFFKNNTSKKKNISVYYNNQEEYNLQNNNNYNSSKKHKTSFSYVNKNENSDKLYNQSKKSIDTNEKIDFNNEIFYNQRSNKKMNRENNFGNLDNNCDKNDYEFASQYGKKDRNIFIPVIQKKQLYSVPRKDKFIFK